MSLQMAWVAHLKDPKKKEEFIKAIKSSRTLIDRFNELLDQMESQIKRSASSTSQYDSPAWAYRTAHENGRMSAIQQIREMFKDL